MRALFFTQSFQFLNYMPGIALLFSLLNTNQIWEQCQPVRELLTWSVNVAIRDNRCPNEPEIPDGKILLAIPMHGGKVK